MIDILRNLNHTLSYNFEVALHHPERFHQSSVAFTASVQECSYDLVSRQVQIVLLDDAEGRVIEHILGLALYPEDEWTLTISTYCRSHAECTRIERFGALRLYAHRAERSYVEKEATRHVIVVAYGASELLR